MNSSQNNLQTHPVSPPLQRKPVNPATPRVVPSWLTSSLVIPNEGSTARDHLTRDRTWMQWIRLSSLLVMVSLATCITFPYKHSAKNDNDDDGDESQDERDLKDYRNPFAIAFLALSIALPLLGLFEYFSIHHSMSLKKGIVQSGFFTGLMVTATCLVLISFTFALYYYE
ncbi:hypothetical protein PCANC_04697 [Puccinia coronata f. sp. avenae]|uniref:DUF202 domain-containing protein n=1 Tax=Puccinia coronata f. sp. avenae TaxID=200324 RepID=A0A2N5W1P4_9BASI|nr:hypothetical protein PCANC_22133 [Puccinia coronata f. sp. avenae]PLW56166.1 hypothetical protein PCANC_04697 [Puccinia coronata f. sp. avenae]